MSLGRPISSNRSAAPYRLRSIMLRHGLAQSGLRDRIRYTSGTRTGQALSPSTLSMLLTRRQWPVTVAEETIRSIAEQFLLEHGVPEAEANEAWDIDGIVDNITDDQANTNPRKKREANQPTSVPPIELPETEMLTPEAREHFALARHPFMDDVQGPQDVYLSKDQRYIRESMYYAAKHAGFLAVIGESGSGKSTLRRDLLDRIRRDNEAIVAVQPQTIDKRVLTAAHICDAIISDLSTETPRMSLEAKARQIKRLLTGSARTGSSHVLIIEEAHDLSTPTLKYLKRFWELEDGFRKLLGIILIGQPELSDRLDEHRNYEAREVIRRLEIARLQALNGNLEAYLELKFKRIGTALDVVFDKEAFDAIRARLTRRRPNTVEVESALYPLIVQNLVTKAMNTAADLGLPKVSKDLVEKL